MAKQNPSVRLVLMNHRASTRLARAVGDDDAELEVALQIAIRHLHDAHNRMDAALMRLGKE